ncbi:MAG TPA: PCYCGC motif-containing (lipo)protein [Terriglobales bacterium]|nr:PCYCGC motif-containing (lipo)protein [Terriglobales bacterium]
MKAFFGVLFSFVLVITLFAQSDTAEIPAYHKQAPATAEKLPPILPREQLWGPAFENAYQVHAYELAPKVSKIIYQLPCYCYCDHIGHKSLRTCYESTHAAHCAVCLKELYYAYDQHKKGKTVAQIRQGIIHGQWQQIDLEAAAGMN